MFKNTRKAFAQFIATVQALTMAVENNTAEQSLLRERLDALVEHSHFMVRTKKREIERSGHRVD